MSTITVADTATARRAPRDTRRVRRLIAAILLPVAPLSVAILRGIWPAFSASDTAESLNAIAAHPAAQEAVVWLGTLAVLTFVPAVLAAARLARRRRPVLAMLAAGVNLAAYLGAAFTLFPQDLLTLVAARGEHDRAELVPFLDAVTTHPSAGVGIGLFVLGHIVGMILLGAALWRIIPVWASVALIVSQPLHLIAFVALQMQVLDALAWGLSAVGFAACALTILRTSDDDWDVAPAARA